MIRLMWINLCLVFIIAINGVNSSNNVNNGKLIPKGSRSFFAEISNQFNQHFKV
jgi:hypothetical protein